MIRNLLLKELVHNIDDHKKLGLILSFITLLVIILYYVHYIINIKINKKKSTFSLLKKNSASNLLSTINLNKDKLKAYECGFEPYGDSRMQFEIHFYLVSILFLIFDIEILFLVPWSISVGYLGFTGFFSMIFFLLLLVIGFIYEVKKGALNW